ncbi:MAG: hypothetical protein K9I36_03245 [Bacteroidia bacterium]|nr:hypothetical protein [Bacteroidia bacterium]MCF8425722.1 hypothetical protein [Bacteroidia bacterium]
MSLKKYIVYAVFILTSFVSSADSYNDSLFQIIKLNQVDTSIAAREKVVIATNKLAYSYFNTRPDSTIFFARNGFILGCKLLNIKLMSISSRFTGLGYDILGDYSAALTYYFRALNLAELSKDTTQLIYSYYSISIVYGYLNQFDQSIEIGHKGLKLAEGGVDPNMEVYFLIHLADDYEKKGNKGALKYCVNRAKELSKKINDPEMIAEVALIVADLPRNNLNEKIKSFNYFKSVNSNYGMINAGLHFAKESLRQGNTEKAIKMGMQVLDLSSKMGSNQMAFEITKILSQSFEKDGNIAGALKYQKLNSLYADTLFNKKSKDQVSRVEERYKYNQQQKALEIASNEKEYELELSKAKIKQTEYLLWTVLLATIIILSIFIWAYKNKEKSNKKLTYLNSILSDQKAIVELNAQTLKNTIEIKDKLFSVIAHDLKGPLNSLILFMELLKDNMLDVEDQKEMFPKVEDSLVQTKELLENLLNWAMVQMGRLNVIPEKINIVEIVSKTCALLKFQADAKNITIDFPKSFNEEEYLVADKNLLSTVLRNLVSNAIKFSYPNGIISLEVTKQKDEFLFSITDSGVGIEEHNIGRLFQSGYTTYGTSNEKGTGLGLELCKEFIKIQGGIIWVESTLGVGSKFQFTLPKDSIPVS